jgi:hypothetical protein
MTTFYLKNFKLSQFALMICPKNFKIVMLAMTVSGWRFNSWIGWITNWMSYQKPT